MKYVRLRSLALLVALSLSSPLLSACGTPAIAGTPESMAVYSNGKPIAQVPTGIPSVAMPGMEMGGSPTISGASVQPTNPPVMAESGTAITPTPTDYVVYNALYGTGTPTGQAASAATTVGGTPAGAVFTSTFVPTVTLPLSATAIPITAIPTQVGTQATTQPAASNGSGSAAALPAGTAELVAQLGLPVNGDPTSGQALFSQMGCSACHDVANGVTIVGPSLKGVAIRAATRKPGYTAIAYLRESILYPNAFVVPGFPQGVMPQTFGQNLSKQQIDDIVSYLLTLKQ